MGGDACVWPIAGATAPKVNPPANAAPLFRNALRAPRFEAMCPPSQIGRPPIALPRPRVYARASGHQLDDFRNDLREISPRPLHLPRVQAYWPPTRLASESHDEAVPIRESRDAWIGRDGDALRLPPRANIRTGRASAAGGDRRVSLGSGCGHARLESRAHRSVLRHLSQRTTE